MQRKTFIRLIGGTTASILLAAKLVACAASKRFSIARIGPDFSKGHLLRTNTRDEYEHWPTLKFEHECVIVGGGISGLTASHALIKAGYQDFVLLELENEVGGNSRSGKNAYTSFPLGAHYLSLPNPENQQLIDFLTEIDLIKGKDEHGLICNEMHLCHSPTERLQIRGYFQPGLVPNYGLDEGVKKEIQTFFDSMDVYREKKTSTVHHFSIPLSLGDASSYVPSLDQITFATYLDQNGFKSKELRWYLDYCCRDDFGAGIDKVSAWAGIHFFAGRRPKASNANATEVFTWAEGNSFLVQKLREKSTSNIRTNILVSKVKELEGHCTIEALDFSNKQRYIIKAHQVIMATPSYVTKHILHSSNWPKAFFNSYVHHPWLIGVVVLDTIPEGTGVELSWDNVQFGSKGLGYVFHQNQSLQIVADKVVVNVYLALDNDLPINERSKLFTASNEVLAEAVINELKKMHPSIEEHINSVTLQVMGHGMITPYPGSYQKHLKFKQMQQTSKQVYLAHSDYSGYSVFEEAFDQGMEAAKWAMPLER